jgi:hypothetical protein
VSKDGLDRLVVDSQAVEVGRTKDTQMGAKSKHEKNIVYTANVMTALGFYVQCRLDFAFLNTRDNHAADQHCEGLIR